MGQNVRAAWSRLMQMGLHMHSCQVFALVDQRRKVRIAGEAFSFLGKSMYDMTDEEREEFIALCGEKVIACYNGGARDRAQTWMLAQREAIMQRSPRKVFSMEQCYFCEQGDVAREKAGQ